MKNKGLIILCILLTSGVFVGCNNKGDSSLNDLDASASPQIITSQNQSQEDLTSYSISLSYSMGGKVSNATISLLDNNKNVVSSGKANENGSYTVSLPKGEYEVNVSDMDEHYYLDNDKFHISDRNPNIDILVRSKLLPNEKYKIGDRMYDYAFIEATSDQKVYLGDVLSESKNKFVVINMWFVTCGPCERDFEALKPAYEEYKDVMEVLAVTFDINSKVKTYKESHGLSFPMGHDPKNELISGTMTELFPTTLFIDKTGRIDFSFSFSCTKTNIWKEAFNYYSGNNYVPGNFPVSILTH